MVQATSSSYVTAEMNESWKDFLHEQINSFVKWDLVRFFHDNPHTADTADSIARVVGRDNATVKRELDGLVGSGLLQVKQVGGTSIYTITTNSKLRERIRAFITACHDRQFRIQAINHMMNGMSYTAHR